MCLLAPFNTLLEHFIAYFLTGFAYLLTDFATGSVEGQETVSARTNLRSKYRSNNDCSVESCFFIAMTLFLNVSFLHPDYMQWFSRKLGNIASCVKHKETQIQNVMVKS